MFLKKKFGWMTMDDRTDGWKGRPTPDKTKDII
jgi:hypothetical protein